MSDYDDSWVVCPYYKKCEGAQITCEGLSSCETMMMGFNSRESRQRYMMRCCNNLSGYGKCVFAKLHDDK